MRKQRLLMNWKMFLLLICISSFSMSLFAQGRKLTGTVTDDKGQSLIGATVKLKSGRLTTSTDVNGKFSLNVANNESAIIVTYIGYIDQEVPISATSNDLTVKLSTSARSLNDVVVVGYGTQRKKDVTGSVASISAANLAEVPATNVGDQLKGRIAGLDITSTGTTPGAVGQIRLRGERSFATSNSNANNQNGPLFVVDGIPFIGGSLNDINQDDIASVDVLKDASAAAIYGSRASGGVIIITTKRGKAGKAVISFDGYYGLSKITDEYPIMNGAQYTAFKRESIAGNSSASSPNSTAYPFTTAELAGINNGTSTDWQKLLYRNGFSMDNQLNVSGGNENTQFSISTGYHKETGIQYGQNFDRGSLRASIDHNINNRIKIGLTTFQSLTHINGANLFPLYNAVAISPLTSPYNADGSVNLLPMTGSVDQPNRINPLTIRNQYIQNLNRKLYSFNTLYAEINIIDGLKYRFNAALTYGQNQGNNYSPVNTAYNTATSPTQTSESVSNSENYTWLLENILTYDKHFGQKHHLTFTGLYSTEKDHSQGLQIYGVGSPADYLQSYNLFLANQVNFSSTNQPSYADRGLISYMARVNYAFNDKYLLTATVRTDGSSVLDPKHRYYTYPAFALGWNIDRENFMKNVSFVNSLKLRAGYGVTADQNVSPYQILGNLSSNAYNFGANGQNGYLVTNLASSLKFEHTNNYNLGIDFGLFNDRLTGAIDVYKQKTYDILQVESLPPSNGASSTTVNAGNSKGKGLEISLSSVNLRSAHGFNWSTDFNIAFARSVIVSLHDNLSADVTNGWFVGQPFNVIYDYKKIGIWQTDQATQAAVYGQKPGQIRVQDVNNDGKINASDLQILGNYQPNYTAGITNRFSFRGFDLSFVAFARMGQKVAVTYLGADAGAQGYPFFNQGRVNQANVNYWTPTNPTNDFPRPDANLSGPTYASTLQYRDGSFIKMRSINLGYTFSGESVKKAGFRSLHVYATCNNPFIIYSPLVKSGLAIDPEGNGYGNQLAGASSFSSDALGRAVTVGLSNPVARTFQLGVNAKF
ncbi:SusC/RagA family TonB-linked outer membrane protein [Mucilaginibacter sp. FT3.2]|uniref:SusC/RagA family TonB-linked outer membrane protein n=1 Tax=Mucilaginibacter sp. FT3.2 TaxID=2723090 RepID=UPI00160EBA59|nr:TonB-dependent receptor [Mucilaginibacter sp. FT3.2]MBB6229834.1 TonB-linked SusC/RagA family outer membrane protein [Mucilaginibacter sp. FT3.2]